MEALWKKDLSTWSLVLNWPMAHYVEVTSDKALVVKATNEDILSIIRKRK